MRIVNRKRTVRYEVRYQNESMWNYDLDLQGFIVLGRFHTRHGASWWLKNNADKQYMDNYKIVEVTKVEIA